MVANFPQLHENAHDAEEIAIGQDVPCFVGVDVLVVQQSLPPRKIALHNMLYLFRKLLLDVALHAAEKERTQD